ncbi:F0F1 ATP synthase subunit A [Winkia sp. ACRQY]|uniref:F0F1 ATP synthase subunit A n=1 Tax=Winkia sp. ACRQY TaxID=2918182 RepID=UPI001EF37215|nr:F0F1 ATP synthase subunit A [Winkia sp. ACRQY]
MLRALAVGNAVVHTSGEFHTPSLDDFFPPVFAFEGTPFAMNRVMVIRLVMLAIMVILLLVYARRARLVPGRAQATMELLFDFVRTSISEQAMGKTMAAKYNGVVAVVFFTALFMNFAGIIPGLNLAGTSVAGLPILMAIVAWVAFIWAGIREQGVGGFFKSALFPPGVPKPIYLILTPIEALSTFIIRPFTLFVRLMANMISGHFMLALCLAGTNFLLLYMQGPLRAVGILTFLGAIFVTMFEMVVAFLQAYIFGILTAVYIDLSVHSH